MEHAKITRHEINVATCQAGVASPDEVHTAIPRTTVPSR